MSDEGGLTFPTFVRRPEVPDVRLKPDEAQPLHSFGEGARRHSAALPLV